MRDSRQGDRKTIEKSAIKNPEKSATRTPDSHRGGNWWLQWAAWYERVAINDFDRAEVAGGSIHPNKRLHKQKPNVGRQPLDDVENKGAVCLKPHWAVALWFIGGRKRTCPQLIWTFSLRDLVGIQPEKEPSYARHDRQHHPNYPIPGRKRCKLRPKTIQNWRTH